MVIVPSKVLHIDEEVMVSVELPELAVDDVEVLLGELCQLVDICYGLQPGCILQEALQLCALDPPPTGPCWPHRPRLTV